MPAHTPSFFRKIRNGIEFFFLWLIFGFFRLLPFAVASNVSGWIARHLGTLLPVTQVAVRNLARAFPEWPDEKHQQIIADMWEGLGRYAGELPHLASMPSERFLELCEFVGKGHLDASTKQASLFFSCHMANWELGAKASHALGIPLSIVYRPLNNPLVDRLVNGYRNQYQASGIPKTSAGGRELLSAMKKGGRVAILMDQKMSTGIPIPFFGHDAMTTSSIADLALKFDAPIYPARVERIGHAARFRVTVYPPLEVKKSGDQAQDVRAILLEMHRVMESWIRERPEQWFWLHNRWGDTAATPSDVS